VRTWRMCLLRLDGPCLGVVFSCLIPGIEAMAFVNQP